MIWACARATALAAAFVALVGVRYADVAAPAVLGRPFNVYWDGRHAAELLQFRQALRDWELDEARRQAELAALRSDVKTGLDQIAARLLDRQRRQIGVIQRAFGHHPVHRQPQLLADLRHRKLGHAGVAPPLFGQKRMGIADCPLAALYRHIHQTASTRVDRGNPASRSPQVKKQSKPSGNSARLA